MGLFFVCVAEVNVAECIWAIVYDAKWVSRQEFGTFGPHLHLLRPQIFAECLTVCRTVTLVTDEGAAAIGHCDCRVLNPTQVARISGFAPIRNPVKALVEEEDG